jgi:hypothetical protein
MVWADAVSEYVALTTDDDHLLPHSTCAANARRIVACINALQGVPTEQLEEAARAGITDVSLGNLFSSRLALQKQRDQLREALKFYANPEVYKPDSTGRVGDLTFSARAALAAAGGE